MPEEKRKLCVFASDGESGLTCIINLQHVSAIIPLTASDRGAKDAPKDGHSIVVFVGNKVSVCREQMDYWEKVYLDKGLIELPVDPGTNPT